MLLQVENLEVKYGNIQALHGINFHVNEGEIVTLIGANEAGKSTTLRAISGLNHPTIREIWFQDKRIDKLPPEKINKAGIAQVPEGRRVFPQMTVKAQPGGPPTSAPDMKMVFHHFPVLEERQKQAGGTLSGGEQQMLAMGRALMSNPRLLLMDEPSLGLSPIMCQEIARIIRDVHAEGRTVVLVEQNARLALSLADRGYVLETGNVALHGPASELRGNDLVRKTYLGLSDD